jgi:hypothetical protein
MDPSTILGIVAVVISVVSGIVTAINHTRIRSNCFGQKLEVSLDIDKTTPVEKKTALINEASDSSKGNIST